MEFVEEKFNRLTELATKTQDLKGSLKGEIQELKAKAQKEHEEYEKIVFGGTEEEINQAFDVWKATRNEIERKEARLNALNKTEQNEAYKDLVLEALLEARKNEKTARKEFDKTIQIIEEAKLDFIKSIIKQFEHAENLSKATKRVGFLAKYTDYPEEALGGEYHPKLGYRKHKDAWDLFNQQIEKGLFTRQFLLDIKDAMEGGEK